MPKLKPKPPAPSEPAATPVDRPVRSRDPEFALPAPTHLDELPPLEFCPTCGTAMAGNRCEVDGHQKADT